MTYDPVAAAIRLATRAYGKTPRRRLVIDAERRRVQHARSTCPPGCTCAVDAGELLTECCTVIKRGRK